MTRVEFTGKMLDALSTARSNGDAAFEEGLSNELFSYDYKTKWTDRGILWEDDKYMHEEHIWAPQEVRQ